MSLEHSAKSAGSDDVQSLVPIREISRLTGVNTVTLRAWERRYGLLKPQRTESGHRLYSSADVERVKDIQKWLARGLAIGKVKTILSEQHSADGEPLIDSVWREFAVQFLQWLNDFKRRPMAHRLEELFSLYPADMLSDQLLLPLALQFCEPGAANNARLAFYGSVLEEEVYQGQARMRQLPTCASVLILTVTENELRIPGLLLNYSLLVNQLGAEYLHYLPVAEAHLLAQSLKVNLLVIVGYESLALPDLQAFIAQWSDRSALPLLIVGRIANVYRTLVEQVNSQVYTAETLEEAMGWIKSEQVSLSADGQNPGQQR